MAQRVSRGRSRGLCHFPAGLPSLLTPTFPTRTGTACSRSGWMRIFSLLTLVALSVHAWVGMWTISTDYLTPMALGKAATVVRFLFQAVCGMAMFAFFVWGVQILWGM
ncbi:succinate dehydrogenase, hydrophobic membrane anchor protein [Pseudomonas aeruginosa]